MYNEYREKSLAECGQVALDVPTLKMPTVGENIDRQIEHHKAAIARLEATKASLEKANLLEIKISDLREVMSY